MTQTVSASDTGRAGAGVVAVSVAVASAIFAFDLSYPLGVAGGVPYVALVLLGLWWPQRQAVFALAVAATLLTLLGYFLSPEGGVPWMVAVNRSLAVFAIWVTAVTVFERKRAESSLRRAHDSLETRVAQRTLELADANEALKREAAERERAGAELRESEQRLSLAAESAKFGTWARTTPDDRVIWDVSTEAIFGLEPGTFEGTMDAFLAYVHPDDRERIETGQARAMAEDAPYELDYRIIWPDGSVRHIATRASPIRGDDGLPSRIVGMLLDITERKRIEEVLRDSEARYRELFESSPMPMWEDDWSAVKRYVDGLRHRGVEDLSGYFRDHPEAAAEIANAVVVIDVNAAAVDLYRAVDKDRFIADMNRGLANALFEGFVDRVVALAGGARRLTVEVAAMRCDGEEFDMRLSMAVARDDWSRILATTEDITGRKRAVDALRRSEASLAKAQSIAKLGNWELDEVTGELRWSDEVCRIFGVDRDAFPGTSEAFYALVHPEDRDLVREANRAVCKDGILSIDHRIVRADGEVRYVHEDAELILDADGKILRVVGTLQDITVQKQAEETLRQSHDVLEAAVSERTAELRREVAEHEAAEAALRESERNLAEASRIARLGHWRWAADSDRISWSVEAHRILGVSKNRLGTTFERYRRLIHPDDGELMMAVDRNIREFNKPYSVEYRVVSAKGEVRYIHDVGEPQCDETGRVIGAKGTIQDVTERRTLEQQLLQTSKLATLGEVAAGIAHELSQPLHIIRMAADSCSLLREEGQEDLDYHWEQFEVIGGQTQRMAEIIDHMRVFGRADDADPVDFDPAAAVRRAVAMVEEQLRLDGISVAATLPDSCRPVLGRPVRLEQVVLNLLNNARDAIRAKPAGRRRSKGPAGHIAVSVVDDPRGGTVVIAVDDDGIGIPADTLDRIFEPFFTTKETGSGTGLGLSISYGIVADMGGAIVARNQSKGMRFEITLPAAEAAVPLPAAAD